MYASNSSAPASDWRNFRAIANAEKAGIEIRFPVTPPDDIRELLGSKGQGYRFTGSNNDPRWYAGSTPARWIWLRQFAAQYAAYGAIVDDSPSGAMPHTQPATGSTKNTRYRDRHRGSKSRSNGQTAGKSPQPMTNNVTPIRPPHPTPHTPTSPPTDMSHLDALMALIGDPDELLAWTEQLIAQHWQTDLKQLVAARCPQALSARFAIAQLQAEAAAIALASQLAQLRCAMSAIAPQPQALPPTPDKPEEPAAPQIAPPPVNPPPVEQTTPPAAVEADAAKKALRGKPRVVFLAPKRPSLPSTPTTQVATATPRIDSELITPSQIGQPKPTIQAPRLTERPSIVGQPVILDDEALTDTERYVGCYAVLDGQLGLSFKGLRMPIKFRAQGLIDPYEAQPGTFQPLKASRALVNRMQAMIWIWLNWQQLLRLEQDRDTSDVKLQTDRQQFNWVYDKFAATHGTIAANAHLLLFEGMQDPRLTALRSLEQDGQKAPIFCTRTHFPKRDLSGKRYEEVSDENLAAALTLSLAEYGDVKVGAIAVWFDITPEQAEAALVEAGLCCLEPIFPEAQGHRSFIAEIDESVELPQDKPKKSGDRDN